MNIASILRQNIAGKLLNHFAVFIINIMMVRLVGVTLSGRYFNELYLLNFVAIFLSMGLDYSSIAWLSNQPRLQSSVYHLLTRVVLFFGVMAAFFFLVIIPFFNWNLLQSEWAMFFFLSGNLMLILFQGMLSASKRFNLQNFILLITNVIFIAILALLSLFSMPGLKLLSLLYGTLFFIQGILMAMFSYKKDDKMPAIHLSAFYAHGIRIMLASLVYFCFLRVDNFFVERYEDAQTLSNYIQCGKIGQYFLYFSAVISSTLLPFIADEKIAVSYKEWMKMMRPYFILIVTGAFLIAIFGSWIYPFMFGAEFAMMQPIMLLLLPGYVSLGLLTLVNAIYLGKGNVMRIFRGDLMGFLLVFAFDWILVKKYGVKAAAIVSSFVYFLVFVYLWVDVKKQFNETLEEKKG